MPKPPVFLKRLASALLPDRVLLAVKKRYYAKSLLETSETDEPDYAIVKLLVQAGDTVADVGANVGVYTKLLSELVGDGGSVFSFEPIPTTFEVLQSNVQRLGFSNVAVHAVALSDAKRSVVMQVPHYNHGGENYHMAQIVEGEPNGHLRHFTIETATLDSYFQAATPPLSFVKCDVEGHELSAVKGALAVIKRDHPAWLLEISGNPDEPESAAAELFAIFAGEGYKPYWYREGVLHLRQLGQTSVNFFFLREDHIQSLRDRITIHQ